jgi:hypothetical protein
MATHNRADDLDVLDLALIDRLNVVSQHANVG